MELSFARGYTAKPSFVVNSISDAGYLICPTLSRTYRIVWARVQTSFCTERTEQRFRINTTRPARRGDSEGTPDSIAMWLIHAYSRRLHARPRARNIQHVQIVRYAKEVVLYFNPSIKSNNGPAPIAELPKSSKLQLSIDCGQSAVMRRSSLREIQAVEEVRRSHFGDFFDSTVLGSPLSWTGAFVPINHVLLLCSTERQT